jgi:predicted ATPase
MTRMLLEREQLLTRLQDLLADARSGHGRLVFLGGQAGAGKSTLVAELALRSGDDATFRRGASDTSHRPPPWAR